jgi:nicotinate-nucleotide pyrophosphorylase (carboxylating)
MNYSTQLNDFIRRALEEDLGDGDHTSLACIPADKTGTMYLLAKEPGILAGVDAALAVLHAVDPTITTKLFLKDGAAIKPGDIAFEASGSRQSLLAAERLLLNIMQRMSGIATKTNHLVQLVAGTGAKILDTRKTTPNMRFLEKEAVKIGGGTNHRFGLYDMIMIKDNHIDFAGGIAQAIDTVHTYLKSVGKDLKIEIEVRDFNELEQVLQRGGVHRIMLDNFSLTDTKTAVERIAGAYETEASGGITEATIAEVARCGVDFISVGALTHHIKSLDLSLKAR